MKRLRNIGIYYTLFGILLLVSFIFTNLWRISILGIFLLLIYFTIRIGFKKKKIETKLTKSQLILWDLFSVLFPFIYVALTCWYVSRPYKQTIVIPKNYEGVVAIQYNEPNGQEKKWIGGFLGIRSSRLIEVDSTGTTKTQFKFHHNAIPFLGLRQTYHNRGGLKIYYANDLENEVVVGANGENITYENMKDDLANIYFVDYNFIHKPHIVFVVTNKKRYSHYFMTMQEKIEQYKSVYKEYPKYPARLEDYHKLNNDFKKYNDFK